MINEGISKADSKSSSLDDGRPTIAMIVAASENNAIGKDNQLLWHLPNDLKFFKNTTWGFPVIMGRKSFESVGKPLPGRTNIVVTRRPDWKAADTITVASIEEGVQQAITTTNSKLIFITGGGEIYKQSMDITDIIYMTRVHATLDGDTFFPVIDEEKWKLVSNEDFDADDKHQYSYSFQKWEKK
ncbi:dihydrofolate reductase [Ferruginibacter paludis]|uniref:dihydrofolate reductase n=1 Tax=Ferruginibacter paludis TaxID=1310417 RepID=UPI0025B31BA9|nr:dihydrofolate reductase [Ferruginibacter paludis]MDN3654472.1 dihydrofolate reductase [Ferruginibacter paludis]